MSARSRWMSRLAHFCWRHRAVSLGSVSLSVGSAVLDLLAPLLIMSLVDDAIQGDTSHLPSLVGALVMLAAVRFVASSARSYVGARLAYTVHDDLRRAIFSSAHRADGATQDGMKIGRVVSRVTGDLTVVRNLLHIAPGAAGPLLVILGALCVMTWISPLLTVIAFAVLPLASLPSLRQRRKIFAATSSAQQTAAGLIHHFEEKIAGLRVVKNFGQEEREIAEALRQASQLFSEQMRCARLAAPATGTLSAVPGLSQVCVLALGGWLAIHGSFSTGEFLAFAAYLTRLVAPSNYLADLVVQVQLAHSSATRVFELIDSKPSLRDGHRPLPEGPLAVKFNRVSFGYPNAATVFDDFTFEAPAGKVTAIVGTSASGGSTLLKLLLRFYDVQAGTVYVGGLDVRDVKRQSLRAATGVVFEDDLLFSGSIWSNITLGHPAASYYEVRRAADHAQAHNFINQLPEGYQTRLGERGEELSGGQRQRVALARALLPDPRLLLLDDPTSSIDALTETSMLEALRGVVKGRTTILVTRRPSTLAIADYIAVLDNGTLVDFGTAAELRERCDLFLRLMGDSGTNDGEPIPVTGSSSMAGDRGGGLASDAANRDLWPRDEPDEHLQPSPWGGGERGHGGLETKLARLPPLKDLPQSATDPPNAHGAAAITARRYFLDLLGLQRWPLLSAACLVAAGTLGTAALPSLFRMGIDDGLLKSRLDVMVAIAGLGLLIAIGAGVAAAAQATTIARIGENVLYVLRLRSFSQLVRLGLDFHSREPAGAIITRVTSDLSAISVFVQIGLTNSIVNLATVVGVFILLTIADVTLGLIVLGTFPLLALATIVFRRQSAPVYREARERATAVNADLREKVSGLRVVQAFGHQQRAAKVFARLSTAYWRARMRAHTYVAIYFPFASLLAGVAQALVLAVGAARVASGDLSPGVLVAAVLYLGLFFNGISQLSSIFDVYQQARIGWRRVYELLSLGVTGDDATESLALPNHSRGRLDLCDVSFGYPGSDRPAIRHVSISIGAGEKVAFVGTTGAGKSTLMDLVARMYDVDAGAILVDGIDIRRYNPHHYRRLLGVMPQDTYLFSGTVAENISYGQPGASAAEIEEAVHQVGALNAIAQLPLGFLQPVSQRGANLSAGQRQLIAFARAQLVRPLILLLDEATAALDPATEASVLNAWEQLSRNKTVLIVAHRLATAEVCDRVVVMDDGRVVEQGPPELLRTQNGFYARLCAAATPLT